MFANITAAIGLQLNSNMFADMTAAVGLQL
jgi:hypothetical protein